MKTTNVGLKVSNKFLTIKNVEPKNIAEKNSANNDLFLSLNNIWLNNNICLLYTSPSPRDRTRSRMPSSA